MANSEQRYGPTMDTLQGFDLRTDMDTIEEPSRLPLLVVIALVVLAAFAGVVWLAYTQGVERGRASVSRELIAREMWTVRKSHLPPYTGLKIYEQPSAAADQNTISPAPPKRAATNAIPALRPTASAMADKMAANPAAAETGPAAATPMAGAKPHAPAIDGQIPPAAAKPHSQTVATAQPQTAEVPQLQRAATHAPTELVKPAAAPAMHPITSLDSPPPPSSQVATRSATPALPSSAAAPPATPAPQAISGVVLQIGSYKSEAEARQSWNSFKSNHEAAAGYQADVRAADLGARGTWYRLRMGPFADRKAALQVCARLKADGASCLLAQ
jgi:cell division protein FtsN